MERFSFYLPEHLKKKLQDRYTETGESIANQIRTAIHEALKRKEKDNEFSTPSFSKEQVIAIVAEFGRKYNTDAFLGRGESLNEAIEEVEDLINWDINYKKG
jgi:hypothetical protein